MKIRLSAGIQILVITGPESSGKTTLANKLHQNYGIPTIAEYARTYLTQKEGTYVYEDLELIAKCQNIQENQAHTKYPLILCDTDLVTIEIWSQEVFGKTINLPIPHTSKKHYLLCKPDIPWEADQLRENPADRDRLFEVYEAYLTKNELSYTVLDRDDRSNLTLN